MKNLEKNLMACVKIVGGVGVMALSLYLVNMESSSPSRNYENILGYSVMGFLGGVVAVHGAYDFEDEGR
jgi:hypothetical protein